MGIFQFCGVLISTQIRSSVFWGNRDFPFNKLRAWSSSKLLYHTYSSPYAMLLWPMLGLFFNKAEEKIKMWAFILVVLRQRREFVISSSLDNAWKWVSQGGLIDDLQVLKSPEASSKGISKALLDFQGLFSTVLHRKNWGWERTIES